ncbi:MAG: tape measure protein, partial [Dolichospermum sp.]
MQKLYRQSGYRSEGLASFEDIKNEISRLINEIKQSVGAVDPEVQFREASAKIHENLKRIYKDLDKFSKAENIINRRYTAATDPNPQFSEASARIHENLNRFNKEKYTGDKDPKVQFREAVQKIQEIINRIYENVNRFDKAGNVINEKYAATDPEVQFDEASAKIHEILNEMHENLNEYVANTASQLDAFGGKDNGFKRFILFVKSELNGSNGFLSLIKKSTGVVAGFVASFIGFQAIQAFSGQLKQFADRSIEVASNLEVIKSNIYAVSGSSVEASKNIQLFTKQSKELGLNRQTVLEGATTFLAATQDTQMEGDVSREILSNFNVMVRNRNLNQDQQSRALVALGQMASKGTIQTEELKGQLAEALPGSYQTFARSLGLSSKQFAKQLKLGNIESTDLTKFSQQAYAENILGIPRSMDTYGASVGKLNNSIMDLQESTGKVAMSFQKLINNLSASTLDLVSSNIDKIIYGLNFLIVVLSKAVWLPMIKGAMQFIKTLSLGQLALKGFFASVSLLINGLKRLTAEFLLFTAVTSAIDKLRISFSDLSGDLGKQIQQQTNLIKDYKSTVDSLGDRKPTRSYWDDLKVFGGSFVNNLPFIGDNGEKVKARRDTELKIAESRKNSSFLLRESDNILNNGSIDNLNRIDLKIDKNQVNQRALIQFNPRDADGLKELKRQEKELLDIRRKTVLPIGKLQGNLSSQIEVKKNEIEYLKELKNDASLYGFEIERNNKALAKSEKELENLEKAQTKITQAVGKTLTAYNLMQRQIRSVASDLEDRKSDLDSLATNKKTYLSGENIAGSISPGNLQLASSQLNISTLKQQFKADADAVSQYKSIFQLPDAQKVLQAFKVTGSTGIGRINQIIEGLENDKDKYVLQQFVEYQKLSRSLTQAESQIRDAQSGLADSLRSQTKQVADYYRTAVREAQAVSFEFQKAQKTLENSRMQNKLREALIGAGDNIYTQFIEGIINIISQTTEIQKQQFEARKQQIDYENNIQDIKLQASELQRSLPGKIIPIDSSLTDEFNLSLKNINTTVNTINTSIGKVADSLSNEVV